MRKYIPVLLLGTFLSACTVGKAGDSSLQVYIAIAESYVLIAADAADTCILRQLPLCAGKEDEIAQAKAVAFEAIAEAKQLAKDGAGENIVRTTLRIAMNALLLFYPAK